MNVDQLLAIVEDLSVFTTIEQLANRLSQCQTAYDQMKGSSVPSGKSETERTEMLLAAMAKIQNKITAIKFSEGREAQRV